MTGRELGSESRPDHKGLDELGILRTMLADACRRTGMTVTAVDIEILELLFAGHNAASTAQATGLPIAEVRQSRERWRRACELVAESRAEGFPDGSLLT